MNIPGVRQCRGKSTSLQNNSALGLIVSGINEPVGLPHFFGIFKAFQTAKESANVRPAQRTTSSFHSCDDLAGEDVNGLNLWNTGGLI